MLPSPNRWTIPRLPQERVHKAVVRLDSLLLGAYGTPFVTVDVASVAGFISRTMRESNGE